MPAGDAILAQLPRFAVETISQSKPVCWRCDDYLKRATVFPCGRVPIPQLRYRHDGVAANISTMAWNSSFRLIIRTDRLATGLAQTLVEHLREQCPLGRIIMRANA